MKAKKLDNMWMSTMAKKDKWSCNTLPPTSTKPKVPWTMNKNTQPKKKEEEKVEKEVKEFDECHKTIKAAETKAVETVKKTVASVEKKEIEKKVESKKDVETVNETVASVAKKEIEKKVESGNIKKEEEKREKSPILNMTVKVSKPEKTEKEEEQKPVQEEKKELKPANKEVKSRQPKIDMEAPINFDEVKKPDPRVVDSLKPPKEEAKKAKESEKRSPEITPETASLAAEPAAASEVPAVLGTPTVRRRGDTFTVTIPLPRGPAPPPPCSRPPPPPMSPPVTASRYINS